jgi:hypothetical protein
MATKEMDLPEILSFDFTIGVVNVKTKAGDIFSANIENIVNKTLINLDNLLSLSNDVINSKIY